MKIGLVRRGYSATGGAENYLRRLAAGLLAAGHVPVLFASLRWPAADRPGGEFHPVAGRGPVAFADRLAALQPKRHCDVLFSLERIWHCDCYRAGDGVHRAWLERRARLEPGWRSWWRRWNPKHRQLLALEAALFGPAGAPVIIANSRLVAAEIAAVYGCTPERIKVIYNGLPEVSLRAATLAERAQARAALRLPPAAYTILFAGTGWGRKGLTCALDALGRLPEQLRPRLLVAGRGDAAAYRNKLPLAAAARVDFLGAVQDLSACYAAADVFVLPTQYDPFSNACLEALASGLPVITTRDNGFAEIISAGVDGDILPEAAGVDGGEALAAALLAWSSDDLRERTRPQRLAKASAFTMDSNVAQTLHVITGR